MNHVSGNQGSAANIVSGENRPSEWTAETPVRMVALQQATALGAVVLTNLPRAAEEGTDDPDPVHKLRVSTRRLTAVLDVFAPHLPDRQVRPFRQLLKRLRKTCGPARDLDVQREFVAKYRETAPEDEQPGLEALHGDLVLRRTQEQWRLIDRLPILLPAVSSMLRELTLAGPETDEMTFGQFGAQVLPPLVTEFFRREEEVTSDPERLHDLRIAGKRLRYALDIFEELLDEEFQTELYPPFQQMQNLLGKIQDAAVGSAEVEQRQRTWRKMSLRAWPTARDEFARLAPGLRGLGQAYLQRQFHAREDFFDFRAARQAGDFHRRLQHAVAILALPSGTTPSANGPATDSEQD